MIFITNSGEIFLLLFHCQFFFSTFHYIKKEEKKSRCRIVLCCLVLPIFAAGIHVPVGVN